MSDDIKPTVLQILPALVTGGVERGTIEMAAAITANGWNAMVASAGGPMMKELKPAGAKHITIPLASKNPYVMWQNIEKITQVIEAYNISIVHARSRAPAWSAYYAAQHTGVPFVTTFHNAYGGKSPLKKLYNSVMAKGERVIAISNFVAEHIKKTYPKAADKIRVIPRGVNIDRFDLAKVEAERSDTLRKAWGIKEGQTTILLPGRLTRWKGQDVFIDAIAKLNRQDVLCLIVGSGSADYRLELVKKINERNLDTVVRLVDECRDMPAAFSIADIVVSASTRPEGFGRVIVEAQAMGCLVVATAHGGAQETIADGETGWLVPPNDAAKLAECLTKILALGDAERKAVGTASINHVRKNFTTALMTQRTLAVYEEVLAPPEAVVIPDDVPQEAPKKS